MSSPLFGAGYLRSPASSGTKEEVLARVKAQLEESWRGGAEIKSPAERHATKCNDLWALIVWRGNTDAAFRPVFEICGPTKPAESTDIRYDDLYGRFGHVRSD